MGEKTAGFLQRRRLHILLLVFLGLLVYSNTFDAPFQFDDLLFVDYREVVSRADRAVSELQADKAAPDVIPLPATAHRGPWASRPLLYATFVLNHLLGGFNTWGYHIVNIALHIGNGVLLYILVIMTGRNLGHKENDTVPVALLSSLIFVLHPVQTEAVTMVVNRSMLMAMAFYLAGLILFLKMATSEGSEKKFYTIGLLVTALMGAVSREDFVTFLLMLFIYDLFFVSRFRLRAVAGHYRGYAAVLPGIALMGFLVLTNTYEMRKEVSSLMLPPERVIPPLQYALTQFKVHWTYIRLLVFPVNQSLLYDYPVAKSFFNIPTMLSMLGYAALWAAGLLLSRKRPAAAYVILWFLVSLLPISFAVTFLGLRLGDPIFEHRLYLPSAGLIVLAALALSRLTRGRRALVPALAVVCLVLGGTAYARNSVWTDRGTLWRDVLKKYPDNPRAHNNIGVILKNNGNTDEAIRHLETAIRFWPTYGQFHSNLGRAYLEKGEPDKAIEHLETALELDPNLAHTHNKLALVYEATGQHEKALGHYLILTRITPWETAPLNNAAKECYALGRKEEAIQYYISSLWLNRKQPLVLHNLGLLFMETGQNERAIKHLEALVALAPDYLPARLALGRLYIEGGYPFRAIVHLQEAVKFHPDEPEVQRALAGAFREVGNTQSADEHLRIAEKLEMSKK
jgi:tetratricopeptide (TPR) repeat protein